jgi:hypothetical protein
MPKKLMIATGRGDYGHNTSKRFPKGFDGRLYVAAYSKADAVRLLKEAGYATMTIGEFNTYWSKGCWGNAMEGVTPERGVWFSPEGTEYTFSKDFKKPIRVI